MPLDMTANANTTEVITSPLSMLYHWEQSRGNDVFLTQPINGEYHDYTWKQVAEQARKVAARLREFDFPQGSRIGIFSKNCAEWFIADLGIMMVYFIYACYVRKYFTIKIFFNSMKKDSKFNQI